jgi:NAD(P)-dependent dehydrogenase (short-subunit alcohol dehydrogenase family)
MVLINECGIAVGIACDVADEAQVAAMVDRAVTEYGRLDMAFNNAGIQVPPSDAADEPLEHFERVTAINQRVVWACMKHELRVMRNQGSGAIVGLRAEIQVSRSVLAGQPRGSLPLRRTTSQSASHPSRSMTDRSRTVQLNVQ